MPSKEPKTRAYFRLTEEQQGIIDHWSQEDDVSRVDIVRAMIEQYDQTRRGLPKGGKLYMITPVRI